MEQSSYFCFGDKVRLARYFQVLFRRGVSKREIRDQVGVALAVAAREVRVEREKAAVLAVPGAAGADAGAVVAETHRKF